jgi:hypothetical protein
LLSVPVNINNEKHEAVGAFMEAMSAESYRSVSPVYFDVAMKVKAARDESVSKMLDIIREGAYMNFASIYNQSIGNPWDVVREHMWDPPSNNFASWYERSEPRIVSAIERLVQRMEDAG